MEACFSVCGPLWIIAGSPSALIKYLTPICPKTQISWVVKMGPGRGQEVKHGRAQCERMKRKPVKTSGSCFRGYVFARISRESCTGHAVPRNSCSQLVPALTHSATVLQKWSFHCLGTVWNKYLQEVKQLEPSRILSVFKTLACFYATRKKKSPWSSQS